MNAWLKEHRLPLLAGLILLAAVSFNLVLLYPEVGQDVPDLNDNVLHYALVQRTVEALEAGEDPTDPWLPYFAQGYPLSHHYQHLPHMATALFYILLNRAPSLWTLFKLLGYLLLSTFPLSIYWTGRRLGFGALPAALAGVLASLLSTPGLYGLDWASYTWHGYGMYTQLWGMWLLGPALAGLYITVRQGRAYAGTAALLAATLLSHTVLGYVALLSGGLFLLLGGRTPLGRRLGRLVLVLLLVGVVASYFLVPFMLDRAYMNRSVWEDPGKYDAYGWPWTLKALATGELLDHNRFPSMTLLAGIGLVASIFRWREAERYRLLPAFFGMWLLLYFGRPTWGVLLDLLPLGRDLHLHRLIAPVQLGAIGLAGVGLAWMWEYVISQGRRWRIALLALLTALLLFPLYRERLEYLALGNRWKQETEMAFEEDGGSVEALLSALEERPPGRVYAGRAANWGDEYRLGAVPVYAVLSVNQFDNPGHLYHALSLNADIEGYLDESRPATFNLFNLRYIVAPERQSVPVFARHQASYGDHWLYRVDTTGYFDLVDSDLILYGEREDWFEAVRSWLQSDLVEAKQHPSIRFGPSPVGEMALLPLETAPGLLSGLSLPQREPCGQISSEQVAQNRYAATFETARSCWLILKATYHPGWQVTLDDRSVEPEMLAPSFVGLPVEPGLHEAVFHYKPGPLRFWLGIAGLGMLGIAAIAEWQRQRWSRWVASRLGAIGLGGALERGGAWLQGLFSGVGREWQWVALLFGFVLLVGLPMLQFKVMGGHDALEYLPRTIEFYRGLQEGHFLPRWAPDLGGGYGYPFFLFNPPLVYYLASFFHALGTSVVVALNLTCLLLLVLAGLGAYCFARDLFGPAGGLAAGVAYVLAPFTLVNLYVRHAFADYAAMVFIPWAFWGLYRWMPLRPFVPGKKGTAGHFLVAVGAVALLFLSSNPVALTVLPLLGLYVLFLAWRARSWRSLRRGLGVLVLGVGLAAFFWLPALVERNWVKTYQLLSGYLDYRNHFVYLHQLVYSPWGYGLSLPGTEDQMSFGLGVLQVVVLVAAAVFAWRSGDRLDRERRAHFWFFVGLLGLVAFLVTDNSIWLWDIFPLLQYLEFPWRILVMAPLVTAVICGFSLVLVGKRFRRWLLVGILAGLFVFGMPHARPERYFDVVDADYAPELIASQGLAVTTTREYEPIWVETRPEGPAPPNRLLLLSGQVRVLESRLTGSRYEWSLEAAGPVALRVTTFYYPGWRLTVDGQPRALTVQNPYGLIDFSLESGTHQVQLVFEPTPLRRAAGWGSLGMLLLTILVALWPQLRKLWERRGI